MSQALSGCAVRAAIQKHGPMPAVGQIWKEADPRVTREIEILKIGQAEAVIQTVGSKRQTLAKLTRFDGKRGGYSYVRG